MTILITQTHLQNLYDYCQSKGIENTRFRNKTGDITGLTVWSRSQIYYQYWLNADFEIDKRFLGFPNFFCPDIEEQIKQILSEAT